MKIQLNIEIDVDFWDNSKISKEIRKNLIFEYIKYRLPISSASSEKYKSFTLNSVKQLLEETNKENK